MGILILNEKIGSMKSSEKKLDFSINRLKYEFYDVQ